MPFYKAYEQFYTLFKCEAPRHSYFLDHLELLAVLDLLAFFSPSSVAILR